VPGVADTPAGVAGNFLAYEDGFFLGFGSRVPEVIRQLATDLHPDLAG
jgi:iron complex transport system substrate-binding protein